MLRTNYLWIVDEKSEKSKEMVREKVKEYMERAEHLKEYLEKQANRKKPVGATDGGSG